MTETTQNFAGEGFRLSPQQASLWSIQQRVAEQSFRAIVAIQLQGDLQPGVLNQSLQILVNRHEILRTTFTRPPGLKTAFQLVGETPRFSWEMVDESHLDHTEQTLSIAEHFHSESERPFDFDQGPLLSVTLIKQSTDKHVLFVSLPALCADSTSLANFTLELSRAYMAFLDQQQLSGEPMQYADFAEWQNQQLELDNADVSAGKAQWQKTEGASVSQPTILLEMGARDAREFRRDSIAVDLNLSFSYIEAVARERKISTSVLLFASWQALLCRLAGKAESEFVIYNLSAGRKFADLEDALGLYAKYLPIHVHCETKCFDENLRIVSTSLKEAEKWQEYFDPRTSANTVGDAVAFDFEERQPSYAAGSVSFSVIKQDVCFSPFKLKLCCVQSGDSISAELQYNRLVFEPATIKRIAGYFQRFLSALLQNSEADLGTIEILDKDERRWALVELNQTATDLSVGKCIHELFEDQVARTPEALAVVSGDQELSYDELNVRANQLAHLLRRRGIGPDARVGLLVERSVETMVGLIGILKAGGAYVPLNPDHPRERLAQQLAQSGASILITNDGTVSHQPFESIETIDLARDRVLFDAQPNTNPEPITGLENLVYVIYTSGSTGMPKGVAVRHRNLTNYTQFILQRLRINRPLNFAIVSTISADLGNSCIFPALASGGCLHILRHEVAMQGDLLREYFTRRSIDVLKIVPSHLSALLASQTDNRILPTRFLILGGEALSWDLVQRIRQMDPGCQLINHYGPTETTVGSLLFSIDPEDFSPYAATVPIGRPIANTQSYILDPHMRPVPAGARGELYIGGAGVSAGYLNQPAETAARFVRDPFSDHSESLLYRTGDLARCLPDGNIEFLGRVDTQVKVRGYRVELGEIEAVLSKRPGVRQVVVTLFRDQSADDRIVAYVVSSPLSLDGLRVALREKLPDYMLPSAFVFLKTLPLSPNGKVDRGALPAPEATRSGLQSGFVAPRSLVEKALTDIWANALKVSAVGVHDNFFELGGHSLVATQVVSRMRKEFKLEIPLRSLFESPTVAQLAEKIDEAKSSETERFLKEVEGLSEEDVKQLLRPESRTSG
ncbi:MAG: amino acid adenylation domain-containing protein [Pyrinomonadaceae bacterium]